MNLPLQLTNVVRVVGGHGCGWAKANVKQLALACGKCCFSFAFAKNSQTALPKIVLSFILPLSFNVSTVVIGLLITIRLLHE